MLILDDEVLNLGQLLLCHFEDDLIVVWVSAVALFRTGWVLPVEHFYHSILT